MTIGLILTSPPVPDLAILQLLQLSVTLEARLAAAQSTMRDVLATLSHRLQAPETS